MVPASSRPPTEPPAAARWGAGLRSADLPPEVAGRGADLLLDTLGVAAAAAVTPAAAIAHELAVAQFGAPAAAAVPLPFDGRPVSPAGAAYAGATRIDSLDAHDGHQATKGHAGVALVPALLAFGPRAAPGGREALAALVAGYEIATRAGIALHATAGDYHARAPGTRSAPPSSGRVCSTWTARPSRGPGARPSTMARGRP